MADVHQVAGHRGGSDGHVLAVSADAVGTHAADFTPPVDAAIAPERSVNPSARYTARFDEGGELLPGHSPRRGDAGHPFTGGEAEIAMAARLKESIGLRAVRALPPPTTRQVFEGLPVHLQNLSEQHNPSRQQGPRQQ